MSYKNPIKPLIDLINRKNTKLGTVSTLHGNVFEPTEALVVSRGTQWFWVQSTGVLPSDIMNNAALEGKTPTTVQSDERGTTSFENYLVEATDGPVLLYTGVRPTSLSGDGHTTVPLEIVAPDAEISVYVNNVPVLKRFNSLNTEIILGNGVNLVAIVLTRSVLKNVRVSLPPNLMFGLLPPAPVASTWAEENPVQYAFIGTKEQSGVMVVSWADSRYAGSWQLERTGYSLVGTAISSAYDDEEDEETFTIVVEGNYEDLSGNILAYPDIVIGNIIESDFDSGDGETTLVISTDLEDQDFSSLGIYVSDVRGVIATIQRQDAFIPKSGYLAFLDTTVKESLPYSYRVRAIHPLHSSVIGEWSSLQTSLALDTVAPGDVDINSIVISTGEVIVNYTAPNDIDYAGVRVFLEDPEDTYTSIVNDFGRPGQVDQFSFYTSGEGTYWLRTFDWSDNVQDEGDGVSLVYAAFNPVLDLDGLELDLLVTITATVQSFRYIVTTNGVPPVEEDVETEPVQTSSPVLVYTFDGSETTTIYVGVKGYSEDDGTGNTTEFKVLPFSLIENNNLEVFAYPAEPNELGKEAVLLVARHTIGDLALYYRYYNQGDTPPAYTRFPASGYDPDPIVEKLQVDKPEADDPPVIIQAYAVSEDATESKVLYLEVDGDAIPTGEFDLDIDRDTGLVKVQPIRYDNDAGSYRFKVVVVEDGDESFVDPEFEVNAAEFAGNTFGGYIELGAGFEVDTGERLLLSGWMFRTNSVSAATQEVSTRSEKLRTQTPAVNRSEPTIEFHPISTAPGDEGGQLVARDEGDDVAIYYRTYTLGDTPPAYTRSPASGYETDPYRIEVTVSKPAEGAANKVIEAYAIDENGNVSVDPVYIEVDGNATPSGSIEVLLDKDTRIPSVRVSRIDSDTGSFRYRVVLEDEGSDDFDDVEWEVDAAEFAGTSFGTFTSLGAGWTVEVGKRLLVSGYVMRTTSTSAVTQQASAKSELLRAKSPSSAGLVAEITTGVDDTTGRVWFQVGTTDENVVKSWRVRANRVPLNDETYDDPDYENVSGMEISGSVAGGYFDSKFSFTTANSVLSDKQQLNLSFVLFVVDAELAATQSAADIKSDPLHIPVPLLRRAEEGVEVDMYVRSSAGQLMVTILPQSNGVKKWSLWIQKGSSPVANDIPDRTYLAFTDRPIEDATYVQQVTEGEYFLAARGTDLNGIQGPLDEDSVEVDSSGDGDPVGHPAGAGWVEDISISKITGPDRHRITWNHIADVGTGEKVKIELDVDGEGLNVLSTPLATAETYDNAIDVCTKGSTGCAWRQHRYVLTHTKSDNTFISEKQIIQYNWVLYT